VSIGDTLADGRRRAGLTVTQVSERTCIRETIIRSIERGDYSGCGGDFYARGHVRSIATAVGVDAAPLLQEYDKTLGEPKQMTAADVFQPVTPVKLRERRRPNWTATLAVALLVVLGVLGYQHYAGGSAAASAGGHAHQARTVAKPKATAGHSSSRPAHAVAAGGPAQPMAITVQAVRNCWVQIRTAWGRVLFSGMVYTGSSMSWTERHAVVMVLGNPAGVRLRVNGKNPVPRGTVNVVTLNLSPRIY
jgi:cytoskeletal protein RodZ